MTEKIKKKKFLQRRFSVDKTPLPPVPLSIIFSGDWDQRDAGHPSKPEGGGRSEPSQAWMDGDSSRNAGPESTGWCYCVLLLFTQGLGRRSSLGINTVVVITTVITVGLAASIDCENVSSEKEDSFTRTSISYAPLCCTTVE